MRHRHPLAAGGAGGCAAWTACRRGGGEVRSAAPAALPLPWRPPWPPILHLPRAGADSVVACDLHESVCDVARRAAAHNGLSSRVSVVHCDAGMLQRGREVRPLGINLVVADMFDAGGRGAGGGVCVLLHAVLCCAVEGAVAGPTRPPRVRPSPALAHAPPPTTGLLGDSFAYALDLARKRVVQPGAVVVPAGATLYCMGVEARTGRVAGFDLSPMDTYRCGRGGAGTGEGTAGQQGRPGVAGCTTGAPRANHATSSHHHHPHSLAHNPHHRPCDPGGTPPTKRWTPRPCPTAASPSPPRSLSSGLMASASRAAGAVCVPSLRAGCRRSAARRMPAPARLPSPAAAAVCTLPPSPAPLSLAGCSAPTNLQGVALEAGGVGGGGAECSGVLVRPAPG